MKKPNTRVYALIGIMSGLAFALYYFEFSVGFLFPAAPYLKVDFSDFPAIITGIAAGPIAGIFVQLLKNILHLIFISKEPAASGEIANFSAGVALMMPFVLLYRKDYQKYKWIAGIIGTILAAIVMMFINYFITFPLYGIPREISWNLILTTFTPFNLLKGALLTVVIVVMYKKVEPAVNRWLSKNR